MTKDVRKIKTERDIQQAMLRLLTTKTFRQITVADICQLSLTSRSTFYAHYLDKYDLLDKMVAYYSTIFNEKVHDRFNQMIDGEIDALVRGLLADMADNRDAIRILFTVHEPEADLEATFHRLLLKEWQQFIKSEAPTMTAPADLIAAMGTNVQMTVIEWALQHGETSIDVVADAVNTIRKAVLLQIKPTMKNK
ncbi:TetR/AcrR family transcriptional regulator [Lactiplantibacillus daowaiensis]|uniref:TetR/AcrR family transcriptional regulator n=1 Tax=Lactiplantibacillus daowaiensis TaxID=2559918 RepID=A0ABW1S275_9LACO|nr:TetR/AcrR family transcriptional regulator [Lactiplantibacillus daowaiensis]